MDNEIIQVLEQRIHQLVDEGRKVIKDEDLQKRLNQLTQETKSLVRKYPYQSMGVGLLAGYLLAKLLSSDEE